MQQTRGQINFQQPSSSSPHNDLSKKAEVKKLLQEVLKVDQIDLDDPEQVQQALDEGHQDFIKESAKEEEKNSRKLDALTAGATLLLFKARTANPFDLFPDEVIIDTNKVSIIHNLFFYSSRVHSVMITDVSDVFVDTGFLFAKLSIVDKGFVDNVVEVEYLKKDEAAKIRRIVQGLVVAQSQEIDLAKLQQETNKEEILDKLEKLGKARVGE